MASGGVEFNEGGIRIRGYTAAGEESYYVLPELGIAFDLGRAPRDVLAADHVFLSHGHMDHAAGIAYYFAQRHFIDNPPGHLYVAPALRDPIDRLLQLWAEIDGRVPPSNLHTVEPGRDVELRRDLRVRPFRVDHPCRGRDRSVVHSLGFSVIEVRRKLLEQYQGLTGPQIVELKNRNVEVAQRIEIPLVTYCGDTAVGAFLELDHVRRSRVLLLECTFFDPQHVERARAGNHTHAIDLREVLPKLENEHILITHVSRRTALSEARTQLAAIVGEAAMQRVSFFMQHRSRRGRAGDRQGSSG